MTLAAWPKNAPRCHKCGCGWATLWVPTYQELARHPDEPPYWKCGVCGHVWPLNDEERSEHAVVMEQTRARDTGKPKQQRRGKQTGRR